MNLIQTVPVVCVLKVLSGLNWTLVSLQYLLSEKEIKVKTALWMAENADFLKEQKGSDWF